jgi:hypothetical protein
MTPRNLSTGLPKPPRPKSQMNTALDKSLLAYVTVATAAGVALMAAATPAAAEVVYTRTHVNVGADSTYALDINHDGIADFSLIRCGTCVNHASILLVGFEAAGNQVIARAPAVSARSPIGPAQNFSSRTNYGGVQMVDAGSYSGHSWFFGGWAGATNKYLGLKFLVDGQAHYGWARITVTGTGFGRFLTTLTGYAYETTPNRGIPAGLESGPRAQGTFDPTGLSNRVPQPATLGMLARGADALTLWRREEH